jgi:hypothetical protein
MKYLKTYEGESIFTTMKRMYKKEVGTYEEPIFIYITIFDKTGFIKNEWMDTKVNKYLMNILDVYFDLNLLKDKSGDVARFSVNKFDVNKFDEVKDFLINEVGLEFINLSDKENRKKEYCFKGKMSVNDLKNKI